MKCNRCGIFLNQNHRYCPNCGYDNFEPAQHQNGEVLNQSFNNIKNSDNKSNKSKTVFLILGIAFAILLLPVIVVVLLMFFSKKMFISELDKAAKNSIVTEYKMLEKKVKTNIAMQQFGFSEVSCDENCANLYDYNDEFYDVEVKNMGTYYKIYFEVSDDYVDNFNFTKEMCSGLENAICAGNEIIGTIDAE